MRQKDQGRGSFSLTEPQTMGMGPDLSKLPFLSLSRRKWGGGEGLFLQEGKEDKRATVRRP